jgi:hypothetical protein
LSVFLVTDASHHLSFAGKWKELEDIILNEVSQVQKAKAACLLSYVEYRLNANTSNIRKNFSQ